MDCEPFNEGALSDAFGYLESAPLQRLMDEASEFRSRGHGRTVSFSRKVFIPLTRLCRDVCHYCTFAKPPNRQHRPYLSPDEVLDIARRGKLAGCKEALFTLGERPELRYSTARLHLQELGFESTLAYLAYVADRVHKELGLLPHLNPGTMTRDELAMLRPVSASMGVMLESVSSRLCERGGPHFGSPDKDPALRLETIAAAGQLRIPFTTGILIGIGETRRERLESLAAIGKLHRRYGHIQEVIVQNFRAKPDTRFAEAPEPDLDDLRWTIAAARILLGPRMNIQAPPNLSPDNYEMLIEAGINDWGGISPVTPDHVNPEAPWPEIDMLRRMTAKAGHLLVERLTVYPDYVRTPAAWLDPVMQSAVRLLSDSDGFAREGNWAPGEDVLARDIADLTARPHLARVDGDILRAIDRAIAGQRLESGDIIRLFRARDMDFKAVTEAADVLRRDLAGDLVGYVVNRNINYTNICQFKCGFCAFSKGKSHEALRGKPYDLSTAEISRRVNEAWARGATEVCMQGGIHPAYTGETYLTVCRTVKAVEPAMHIHAFSPLEIAHGAETLSLPVSEFLDMLKAAGLGSLPGTAAEILHDDVRSIICPDKLTAAQWLEIVEAAHRVGVRTTSTIMFGHVDSPDHWAAHLLAIRDLQERTGGFTEFVPLPFIPMEAPLFLKGRTRKGPTLREAVLMHAVSRLVFGALIPNIQTSWVKLGDAGTKMCLSAGANDLGGTLMNESISRAAGTQHGQEKPPHAMRALISSIGRVPWQRSTLYQDAPEHSAIAAETAAELLPTVQTAPTDPRALANLMTESPC